MRQAMISAKLPQLHYYYGNTSLKKKILEIYAILTLEFKIAPILINI